MRIFAFQGFRFAPAAGDPGALAAPPFDQIDEGLRDRLQAESPHHYAHLTRPLDGPEGNKYRHAAAVHRQWQDSGKIERDAEPSLYPYLIRTAQGKEQLGVCTLVGVEDPSSNVIRPHERTLDKPFADRMSLLKETRVDFEPVMFLSDDPGTLETLLREDIAEAEPAVVYQDSAGNHHHLYRVSDPNRIRAYKEALAPCSAAIADGHHRYKVGRTFAADSGAQDGTAAACKMAVLFSLSSDMAIDPIHRGFEAPLNLEALHELLRFRTPIDAGNGTVLAACVAHSDSPALGVMTRDGGAELWGLEPSKMPEGSPPGAENLAVAHLHSVLLPTLGFTTESYLDSTVSYRSDPEMLYEQVKNGTLATGVWLPPMTSEAFGLAISKGDLLPAKATRFLPKLASGMVWSGHEAALL